MQCTRATKAHVRCQFANKAASRVVVAARATSSPNEIGHADANAANDEGQTNDKTNETPTTKLSVSRRTLLSSAPLLAASLAVVVAPPPHLGAIQKATAAAATKKLPKLDPVALYGSVEAAEASRAAAVVALKKTIEPLSSGSVLRYSFHDAGTFDGEKQTGGANGSIFKELDVSGRRLEWKKEKKRATKKIVLFNFSHPFLSSPFSFFLQNKNKNKKLFRVTSDRKTAD